MKARILRIIGIVLWVLSGASIIGNIMLGRILIPSFFIVLGFLFIFPPKKSETHKEIIDGEEKYVTHITTDTRVWKKIGVALGISVCVNLLLGAVGRFLPQKPQQFPEYRVTLSDEQKERLNELEDTNREKAVDIVNEYFEEEFEKGVITETGYESEYLGMKFVAPDGWKMLSEEETSEIVDKNAESHEMDAVNTNTGAFVYLATSDVGDTTIEECIDDIESMFESSQAQIAERSSTVYLGKVYETLKVKTTYQGNSMEVNMRLRLEGKRLVCITVQGLESDQASIEEAFNAFQIK